MAEACDGADDSGEYQLEERLAQLAEAVVDFVRPIPRNEVTRPIILQRVRSATSIGANYCEADGTESDKDFVHKMSLSRKEAHETLYWLRIIARAEPAVKSEARKLWKETDQVVRILATIIRKVRKRIEE